MHVNLTLWLLPWNNQSGPKDFRKHKTPIITIIIIITNTYRKPHTIPSGEEGRVYIAFESSRCWFSTCRLLLQRFCTGSCCARTIEWFACAFLLRHIIPHLPICTHMFCHCKIWMQVSFVWCLAIHKNFNSLRGSKMMETSCFTCIFDITCNKANIIVSTVWFHYISFFITRQELVIRQTLFILTRIGKQHQHLSQIEFFTFFLV